MQITAAAPVREHERPMSWARAILIATGFFFATAILLGQLPSYMFTISTSSTLARFEQGTLVLGLLAVGIGILSLEISLLYDPKPLFPWPLFAVVGAGISAIGLVILYQTSVGLHNTSVLFGQSGGWPEFLPNAERNGNTVTYWPNASQGYLFHPAWFQPGSIDLKSVGLIALVVGMGMVGFAVLNPLVLRGKLNGFLRDVIVRSSMGLSLVVIALYLTLLTFAPEAISVVVDGKRQPGPLGNVLLFVALGSALAGLQTWLLPVMVAHRARFMPAVYLHGVVGLLGNVGIPLLGVFALMYPVVNLIHQVDSAQFWVECSQKTEIPSSCTFSPFTGYIICAIVFSIPFGLLMAGLYFWSTRRDTVVLGGTFGLVYMGLAVTAIHMDDASQLPLGLLIATSITLLAFFWTWSTQREFAPTQATQLGCVGQWLVLGSLLLIYLAGFALFSLPQFFEVEALALYYTPGRGALHDAFWGVLLMSGLGALHIAFLVLRRPMSDLRKFAMWIMIAAIVLELIGAIQGFHHDVLVEGVNAMEGGHAVFVGGIILEALGIGACLYGAMRTGGLFKPWTLVIAGVALFSAAAGVIIYNLPSAYPEVIVFMFILAMVGAFAFTVAGPDEPGERVLAHLNGTHGANGNGRSPSNFVVTR